MCRSEITLPQTTWRLRCLATESDSLGDSRKRRSAGRSLVAGRRSSLGRCRLTGQDLAADWARTLRRDPRLHRLHANSVDAVGVRAGLKRRGHSRPLVAPVVDAGAQAVDKVTIILGERVSKHLPAEGPVVVELALFRASFPMLHDQDQGETLRSHLGKESCASVDLEAVTARGREPRLLARVVRYLLDCEDLVVQIPWIVMARDEGAPRLALLLQIRRKAEGTVLVANDGRALVVDRPDDEVERVLNREGERSAGARPDGRLLLGRQLLVRPSDIPRTREVPRAPFRRSSLS